MLRNLSFGLRVLDQVPQRTDAILDGSPYQGQFREVQPGWLDINVNAAEGRTGRLMFGAGVNSNSGLVGSFVWDESNFDILRPPTSFSDIIEGRAWRGGGQRFRIEAAPGRSGQSLCRELDRSLFSVHRLQSGCERILLQSLTIRTGPKIDTVVVFRSENSLLRNGRVHWRCDLKKSKCAIRGRRRLRACCH